MPPDSQSSSSSSMNINNFDAFKRALDTHDISVESVDVDDSQYFRSLFSKISRWNDADRSDLRKYMSTIRLAKSSPTLQAAYTDAIQVHVSQFKANLDNFIDKCPSLLSNEDMAELLKQKIAQLSSTAASVDSKSSIIVCSSFTSCA